MMEKPISEGSGIEIVHIPGELPPPVPEAEELPPGEEVKVAPPSPWKEWTVLEPEFIGLLASAPGEFLAWRTKWEGWHLSEPTVQRIIGLWQKMEIKAPLWAQAVMLPVMAYAEKYVEYRVWEKAGKPGLKEKDVGSIPPPGRGGEGK